MSCFECGSDYMVENHHVIPKSLGGEKTIPLCLICHSKVHDKDFIKHRTLMLKGIAKAKARGVYKNNGGMKKKETISEFLSKPKNLKCYKILKNGVSLRKASKLSGLSLGTTQKISKLTIK